MAKVTNAEDKLLGTEPNLAGTILDYNDISLIYTYNWYNYHYDSEKSKKWTIDYLKNNQPDLLDLFEKNCNRCPNVLGSLCRQINKGAIPTDYTTSKIELLVRQYSEPKKSKIDKVVYISKNDDEDTFLGALEEHLDGFYQSNYKSKCDITQILAEYKPTMSQTNKALTFYKNLQQEIVQVTTDQEMQQAYGSLTTKQYVAYLKFLADLLESLAAVKETIPVKVRKQRVKKTKSADALVKRVKYMHSFSQLSLVSIPPNNIIGAKVLFFYNTKYKRITKLVSENESGLSIRGTTVIGFDEKQSVCKSVRKPKELLPKILSGGKIILRNILSDLTTKEITPNGRINSDTILLRSTR